jgi:hypothetical protein
MIRQSWTEPHRCLAISSRVIGLTVGGDSVAQQGGDGGAVVVGEVGWHLRALMVVI